jgi:hypothetical protein
MAKLTLRQFSDRLQKFQPIKTADRVVKKSGKFAIDLIQGQMIRGRSPDGSLITPSYQSPFYAEFKQLRNSMPTMGVPDLNLTGDYYKGMVFKGNYPTYMVRSKDSKADELKVKYGDNLGFDKNSAKLFRNENDKDFCNEVVKLFK